MTTFSDPKQNYAALPPIPAGVFTEPLKKPDHVGDDWLEACQRDYSLEEHRVWNELYNQQMERVAGRAASAFIEGLNKLHLGASGVPELKRISYDLNLLTGWSVVPVPTLIPDHIFFWHLANRRFPAGNFIRSNEKLQYIEEPDVFHDIFGHVPLLTNPVFADFMQAYGEAGWKALHYNRLKALGALYWYTVEFGLIQEAQNGLRAYGAGILSGPIEVIFATEAVSPNRIMLNVDRVMRTSYTIDDLQPTYFVIESFQDLYRKTVDRDFDTLYQNLERGFTYANSAVIDVDNVIDRGTQEYFLRGGRGSGASPI
jgi:phenylalanine-4-hydroxylase